MAVVDMAFIGAQTLKSVDLFLGAKAAPPALCGRIQTLFFDSCYRLSFNEFNAVYI
ncbi:hypothetical protein [Comamonas thiooxydans]|uniref:hypothetical protein n=1 Tax=Comamonas thiooxydans TaxID=363952 RepID=UPI0012FEAD34|nr:hypothetical protein [Comamonas thiooxydans]